MAGLFSFWNPTPEPDCSAGVAQRTDRRYPVDVVATALPEPLDEETTGTGAGQYDVKTTERAGRLEVLRYDRIVDGEYQRHSRRLPVTCVLEPELQRTPFTVETQVSGREHLPERAGAYDCVGGPSGIVEDGVAHAHRPVEIREPVREHRGVAVTREGLLPLSGMGEAAEIPQETVQHLRDRSWSTRHVGSSPRSWGIAGRDARSATVTGPDPGAGTTNSGL
jgi:hypothetical protein